MTDRFDARAYWTALPPAEQQRLGEAAMLWFFSVVAETVADHLSDVAVGRWRHASHHALSRLNPPDPGRERIFEGPDLAALGIRACRVCGCTDESACPPGPDGDGCHWIGPDLCSRCDPEAAPLGANWPAPVGWSPISAPVTEPADHIEFDCAECGRHIHHFGPAPGSPPRCATCINMPGWFRTPELRRVFEPDLDWVPPE
jgi:hypothetical protein